MNKHLQNKKLFLALFLILFCGMQLAYAQEGFIHRPFTVNSNGDKVVFSQGNLQYQASTNTWRFAENQWEYVGTQNPFSGNAGGTVIGSDNSNISPTYSGWIDLFGWGTSGYNHGAVCYQPWSTSQTSSDYYAYGSATYNLNDQTGKADWGYNAISNGGNTTNQWRTLTQSEWDYVFNTRTTVSGIRYAKAQVNGVNGVILLPDDWSTSIYLLRGTNTTSTNYKSNTIAARRWSTLERAGAVFLPAAGGRGGSSVGGVGSLGLYWSAACYGSGSAYYVYFDDSNLYTSVNYRYGGRSVRLVRVDENYSFNINTMPDPAEGGAASGGGTFLLGAVCALTATPAAGYTFAYWTENEMIVSTEATYSFEVVGDHNLVANFVQEGNIVFTDANVKAICVANWDTNNDDELSFAEAAAVASIGTVFKGKTNILSFNELQYFISLTAIDEKAFMGCTALAEITIPEYVATIGDKAFVNCPALASVHFNAINCTSMNSVYNGENYSVFMSNQTTFPLTNLTIGSKVKNIPDRAFRGCNQIQNLAIPASVITVGDYAFNECTNLATLTIGGDVIGEYAFFGCSNLETLTIGEGVISIGDCAFWNCPALLTVHFNATNCTSMGEVRDEGWMDEYGIWRYEWVFYSVFKSGNSNYSPSPIASLTIGDNVTRIPDCAFCGCDGLSGSLNIPNSVTSIGDYAFMDCTGFTGNLTLGNSLTEIGAGAFMGCSGFIGDLVIPNSVISIYGEDFASPIDMFTTEIDYQCYGAFMNCSGFTGNLIIGGSVTSIGEGAFSGCSGFTGSLIVPNSVNYIGAHAFFDCIGFTGNLTIPNSVTYLGFGAFANCSGFTGNLTLGNSLTGIWGDTFSGCSGFTGNLVIPNSLREIGEEDFFDCKSFNGELVIGRGVNSIGDGAFSLCSGFTALVLETSAKPIAFPHVLDNSGTSEYLIGVFSGMNQDIPVYVPAGQILDYQNDEEGQWSYFTNYVNQVKFEPDSNNQWSDDFNWSSWEVPTSEDVVCIADNCQLDMDANVLFLYVLDDEDVLTVNSGKTITTTLGVDTQSPSQLIIADGGQLIANNPVQGTVQKHITGYGTGNDGWFTIAAPICDGMPVNSLTTGEYDLYYYDEPAHYWRNQKNSANDFTTLNPAQGYLYANQADMTLNLAGQLNASNAEISIPVTCEGGDLAGFNLVGNPYTNNISITDVKINGTAQTAFYRAEGGNNLMAYVAEDNEPIKPGQGFFVKATVGGTLTFGGVPTRGESRHEGSYIRLVMSKDGQVADRAYLCMGAGKTMEKVSLSNAHSQLYFKNSGERYAVAANENYVPEMPLFLEKANGTYTIEASQLNIECAYLHLIDNLTGTDIDLLATPSYTFTAKNDDYTSRFRLVFSAQPNGEGNENEDFAFISNGNIIVNGEGTLQVIDMMGRIIVQRGVETSYYGVSTSGMTPGVYMLRLVDGENVKTQKIVVR